jgi:hypothetical protein
MTDDALLNTPTTALVIFGAATATAMAINANIIAYSTTVTPFCLFFLTIYSFSPLGKSFELLPSIACSLRAEGKAGPETTK